MSSESVKCVELWAMPGALSHAPLMWGVSPMCYPRVIIKKQSQMLSDWLRLNSVVTFFVT